MMSGNRAAMLNAATVQMENCSQCMEATSSNNKKGILYMVGPNIHHNFYEALGVLDFKWIWFKNE